MCLMDALISVSFLGCSSQFLRESTYLKKIIKPSFVRLKNSVIKDGVGSRVANNIYHALSKYFNVFSLECISLQEEPSRPLRPPLARAWDAGEMRRWSKSANSHRHGREVLSPQHTHSPTLTNSDMKTSYQPSERSCWLGAGPSFE